MRRTDVLGIFPDQGSVERLVGSILMEIDDEWQMGRRCFSRESMRKLTEPELERASPVSPLRLAPVRRPNRTSNDTFSGGAQLLHHLTRRKPPSAAAVHWRRNTGGRVGLFLRRHMSG